MKRLLIAAASVLFIQAAEAADISVVAERTADHPTLILIKGEFKTDQARQNYGLFSALALDQKGGPAIVFLDSPGGNLGTAVSIGLLIQKLGFSTAVAGKTQCLSACALVWMAGKERFMSAEARIGFHAITIIGTHEISSSGNAMAGAYLHQMGITDFNTIKFLTSADPHSMISLRLDDAARYRIAVKTFSLSEPGWAWAQTALNPPPQNNFQAYARGAVRPPSGAPRP